MKTLITVVAILLTSVVAMPELYSQSSVLQETPAQKIENYLTLSFDRSAATDDLPYGGSVTYSTQRVGKTKTYTYEGYEELLSKGAQISETANHIIMQVEGYSGYTKAELIYKETNAVLMDILLEKDKNQIDISRVPAGDYRLVLSNAEGKIKVEKLIIY